MSDSDASLAISEQIGSAVERAITDGRQIANAAFYNRSADVLILLFFPFAVVIDRNSVPELLNVAPDELETLHLSPSGSTLIIESKNLYMETPGLAMRSIASIRSKKMSGGLILDLVQGV